jgi:hypothetical protein
VNRGGSGTGGAHFCARLSAFKVLGLFFCNSIDPSPGWIARPEISKFAEIFWPGLQNSGDAVQIPKRCFFSYICTYIAENWIINFMQATVIITAGKRSRIASINPSRVRDALPSSFVPQHTDNP